MLEKPDIPDELIAAQLKDAYGIEAEEIAFLPLGADANTAVYRVADPGGEEYFLKLRKGEFDELAVEIGAYLHSLGIQVVIPAQETLEGDLWSEMWGYHMVMYPYIQGGDAYEIALVERDWVRLGASLRRVHNATLPQEMTERIPIERFSGKWRERVRRYLVWIDERAFTDPIAAKLCAFMRQHRYDIAHMMRRADALASALVKRRLPLHLCHGDLHPGNLHITPGGNVYLVDWDDVILAPVEHDLMFLSAGMGGVGAPGRRQAEWFFQGYGETDPDTNTLAYYRYERILRDIAEFGRQLLENESGGEDREQSYRFFTGQFEPGNVVETAFERDTGY